MNRERWNRLYNRMLTILAGRPREERSILRTRWLRWAERVTGTTCFFIPWNGKHGEGIYLEIRPADTHLDRRSGAPEQAMVSVLLSEANSAVRSGRLAVSASPPKSPAC